MSTRTSRLSGAVLQPTVSCPVLQLNPDPSYSQLHVIWHLLFFLLLFVFLDLVSCHLVQHKLQKAVSSSADSIKACTRAYCCESGQKELPQEAVQCHACATPRAADAPRITRGGEVSVQWHVGRPAWHIASVQYSTNHYQVRPHNQPTMPA